MNTAKQHYDGLLGDHYQWSVAGEGDPFERPAAWLADHGLTGAARYLDLGAGFGAHAVPLARLGAAVTAVDFHAGLLDQLRAAVDAGGPTDHVGAGRAAASVVTHQADLVAFLIAANETWDTVLCLGDTLTHLPDRPTVQHLLTGAARVLAPRGTLALGYRDHSGPPRTGLDRFIRVRADATRSLLCLLEVIDADRISVTDLVTTVGPDGLRTQLSAYPKLRLAPADVATWAATAGLTLERTSVDHGLVLQVFRAAG